MRGDIRPLFAACALLISPYLVLAGGENGAAFLKIGAGARPAALGEAYTAVADDAVSAFYNPAGLAAVSRIELAATHTQWIQSGRHDSLAAAFPTKWGTFAANVITLSFDDLERRNTDTDLAESTFGSMDAAYGVSYGKKAGPFSWGVGAAYVRQTLDGVSAGAPAGSLGGLWQTPVPGLTLGAAVRNIGGSIQFEQEGDPLPLTAAVGVAGRFMSNRLLGTIEARSVRNESAGFGAGIEAAPPLYKDASGRLRAGYRSDGADADDASGLSLGVGVAFPRWGFDTSWEPYGVLGDTFRYSFRFTF
ncbi:MAG: PorV/PorQ family protein [Elusimicrobia bacterium]|nr:PorV/PorQ family protein [Elusimicrobiota bacterium]MBP9698653.1 PorV/PorQ family protein [Elusimicrobiota bacterium]